jgi:serine/threonine protein kinase
MGLRRGCPCRFVAAQVAAGLDYLSQSQIAHWCVPRSEANLQHCAPAALPLTMPAQCASYSDLKTANLMFTAEGSTKIIDFGLAKIKTTRSSAYQGTLVCRPQRSPSGLGGCDTAESTLTHYGAIPCSITSRARW